MIEDELVHWFKDDKGETHRSALRIESSEAQLVKGFPRDGLLTVRITNSVGAVGFKLNPDEALRLSSILATAARELLVKKRALWQSFDDETC